MWTQFHMKKKTAYIFIRGNFSLYLESGVHFLDPNFPFPLDYDCSSTQGTLALYKPILFRPYYLAFGRLRMVSLFRIATHMSSTPETQCRQNKSPPPLATWLTLESTDNLPHTPFLLVQTQSAYHHHIHRPLTYHLIPP